MRRESIKGLLWLYVRLLPTIFEISVVRENNRHGIASYGWFDAQKLLVTHNGGPCSWPLTEQVWNKVIQVAHEVADELNAAEQNVPHIEASTGGQPPLLKE